MDISEVPRQFFIARVVEALERVDSSVRFTNTAQFRKQQAEAVVDDLLAAIEVVSAVKPVSTSHLRASYDFAGHTFGPNHECIRCGIPREEDVETYFCTNEAGFGNRYVNGERVPGSSWQP